MPPHIFLSPGLPERIQWALTERNATQKWLRDILTGTFSATGPTATNAVKGTKCSASLLIPIAWSLGVSPNWLQTGLGDKKIIDQRYDRITAPDETSQRAVSVTLSEADIAWAQALARENPLSFFAYLEHHKDTASASDSALNLIHALAQAAQSVPSTLAGDPPSKRSLILQYADVYEECYTFLVSYWQNTKRLPEGKLADRAVPPDHPLSLSTIRSTAQSYRDGHHLDFEALLPVDLLKMTDSLWNGTYAIVRHMCDQMQPINRENGTSDPAPSQKPS